MNPRYATTVVYFSPIYSSLTPLTRPFLQRSGLRGRFACPILGLLVARFSLEASGVVFGDRRGCSSARSAKGIVWMFNAVEVTPLAEETSPSPMILAMILAGLLDRSDRLETNRSRSSVSRISFWAVRMFWMCSLRRFLSFGAIPHPIPRMTRGTDMVACSKKSLEAWEKGTCMLVR